MPNVYEITDPDTGKTYRMEADEGVSQEEALADFEALGRDQWSAFEYNPQDTQQQAPAPKTQGSGPVDVSALDPQLEEFVPATRVEFGEGATDLQVPEAQTVTKAQGALIQEDPRNPLEKELSTYASQLEQMIGQGRSDEDIMSFAEQIRKSTGAAVTGLAENLRLRREGKQTGAVTIDNSMFEQAFAPEQPADPGDRSGLERLGDAFAEARQYGFAGWAARFGNDWMDTSKDAIRQAFPGRDEEWYEEMHDYAIVQSQKKLRAEAAMLQEADPNWRPDENFFQAALAIERWGPWFIGQVGGSAGPEMAIAPGASLAARASVQTGLGAVTDIGYQTGDIIAGVEDEISWESVALNGLMGGGGEVLLTGVARSVGLDSARGRGVDSTEVRNARFPRALDPLDQTIQPRTTHDRRTAAYRTETAAAQQSITDRINVLTQDWTNAPEFEVHPDFKGFKDVDNNALGVYRTVVENGQARSVVIMNTDQILAYAERNNVGADDVVRSVVFHEGLGHHGLASRYGQELDTVMASFYDQGDADFRTRVDNYMARTGETDYVLATEETLARMSERGELPVRMMDRLVTFFRGWAREVPWVGSKLKFTDNEVRTLLAMSHRETVEGAPQTGVGSGDKYMDLYHGSPHNFAPTPDNPYGAFDHSRMGTGEGYQAYGKGTYLTESQRLAETRYRDGLSDVVVSFDGREGPIWQLRQIALAKADEKGLNDVLVNEAFTRAQDVGPKYLDGKDLYAHVGHFDNPLAEEYPLLWYQLPDKARQEFEAAANFIKDNYKERSTGKVYKVHVPDDTKFLEWEVPLKEQPDLVEAVESAGYTVTDYNTWNKLNRDAYEARLNYSNLNNRLEALDEVIRRLQETGEAAADIPSLERQADEVFQQLQQASIERNRAVDRAKKYVHEDMRGGDVFQTIENVSNGNAHNVLAEQGIGGNRFLMDNFRKQADRKNDGTDRFNYVIFDDKTPTIIDKYMRPDDLGTLDVIDPNDLSADELFESLNAFDILNRITPDGDRTVYNMEDLEADAAARGISPSALLKAATEGSGSLSKKLFMYDLAAQKMNERVTKLYGKIQSGQYTMRDKDAYLKTILQFEDLTAKIFDQQSEVGRALRAIQEMQFTAKRVTTIRDALRGLNTGLQALDDPKTFEKFAREVDELLKQSPIDKRGNPVIQALNVPRAVMSSMDLSAPLRQGLFFITKPQYWKAFFDMHSAFFSQKKYDAIMDDIAGRPTYEAMIKGRLAFSRIDEAAPLSSREEDFQTDLAAQLPIIGRGVKASNRAYSAFRNKLSADMFDHYYNMMQKSGMDVDNVDILRGMSAFINAATGRGNLPEFLQSAGPQLNTVFFSPRLIMSRINLLNPVFYYKLPPVVRREAIIQAAAMGSLATLTLGAIDAFLPEAEVETDWRHTDFGKVRVGNTRFDVLGGFAQFLRLGARLATGQMISSSGRVSDYKAAPFIQGIHEGLRDLYEYSTGEALAPSDPTNPAYTQTLKDSISQFLENKFSPNASYINDMLKGEDFVGNEFDPVDGALSRIMPMYFQDMAELASEDGPGPITTGIAVVGSLYGVGSNTYVTKSLDPNQELEAPETMRDKDLTDGENEWVTVSNGTITLKPEAREMYNNRLNFYFSQIMEYEMRQQKWAELEARTQSEIISDAREEAQNEARKDMRKLFGID